ncbi:MAG: [FeFe] hydrogenase H-cluster radical SAM maturase HydE [Fusobacteriaceae bacterium]
MLRKLIDKLYENSYLDSQEMLFLIENLDEDSKKYLFEKSFSRRLENYGKTVFLRGLIEISNYCKRDCNYCGIRNSNKDTERYRLTADEIIECCKKGYLLGFRTFVLQGGEDEWFTDERVVAIIKNIKKSCPEAALTLSLGEKTLDSYQKFYDAGADRYLLRHETADMDLYNSLHPNMDFKNRIECLKNLKEIGFQTGAGFLIGLPNQKNEDYVKDLLFLKDLNPHMVGLGPFIPQKNTPLKDCKGGDLETTLVMLAIVRLLLPHVLLPATTALGTIDSKGREKGFRVGANVIMPNLSPFENRAKYALYDGKKFQDDEAAEELKNIIENISLSGFQAVMERGDNVSWKRLESKK